MKTLHSLTIKRAVTGQGNVLESHHVHPKSFEDLGTAGMLSFPVWLTILVCVLISPAIAYLDVAIWAYVALLALVCVESLCLRLMDAGVLLSFSAIWIEVLESVFVSVDLTDFYLHIVVGTVASFGVLIIASVIFIYQELKRFS